MSEAYNFRQFFLLQAKFVLLGYEKGVVKMRINSSPYTDLTLLSLKRAIGN